MTPELATAMARETVEAIRRATKPLQTRLADVDAALVALASKASQEAVHQIAGDVLVLRKAYDDMGAALEALRGELTQRDYPSPAVLGLLDAHKAEAGAQLKALETKCAEMVDESASSVLTLQKGHTEKLAERLLAETGKMRSECEKLIGATVDTLTSKAQTELIGRIDAHLEALTEQHDEHVKATLADALISLSASFETMRKDALDAVQQMRGPPGDGFRYREVYDPEAEYLPGDWVTHDGTLWAALASSRGMVPGTPSAAVVWRMALKRARDGANGIGWNWRGAFAENESYRINDVVRHHGRVFLCRRSTSYAPPAPGGAPASEWALVLE